MLSKLSRFFERHLSPIDGVSSSPQAAFSHKQLAVAALLIEVARADHHIGKEEIEQLPLLLQEKFQLTQKQLTDLIAIAKEQASDATSLHQFTQWINRECSDDEKLQLLTAMWQLAYIDGDLDKYEEYVIRKVADLIYMPHSDFLKARQRARKTLSID